MFRFRGAKSVNGTAVLSGMFLQAGHKVSSWHRLSPKLEKDDVIIWAPDAFGDPGKEQREWLENWLSAEDGRTLVYIGRDYDAAVITAGFAGLGLGATPVAIANMNSITSKFGSSAKAFLIVPLVGAFFIDLLNAVTIKFFIGVISEWLV